jgi:hypothetical protein
MYGFGEGTTMHDNVLVLGEVKVGPQFISQRLGPNTAHGVGAVGGDLFLACHIRPVSLLSDHLAVRLIRTASVGVFNCRTAIVLLPKHAQRGLAVGFHSIEH